MDRPDEEPRRRIRKVDWAAVLRYVDAAPAGTPFLIGRMNRSIVTHINQGRYEHISPDRYWAWSRDREGAKSTIWLTRRP